MGEKVTCRKLFIADKSFLKGIARKNKKYFKKIKKIKFDVRLIHTEKWVS